MQTVDVSVIIVHPLALTFMSHGNFATKMHLNLAVVSPFRASCSEERSQCSAELTEC